MLYCLQTGHAVWPRARPDIEIEDRLVTTCKSAACFLLMWEPPFSLMPRDCCSSYHCESHAYIPQTSPDVSSCALLESLSCNETARFPSGLLYIYIYIHVPGSSEAQLISSSNYHSNSHRELTASKKKTRPQPMYPSRLDGPEGQHCGNGPQYSEGSDGNAVNTDGYPYRRCRVSANCAWLVPPFVFLTRPFSGQ